MIVVGLGFGIGVIRGMGLQQPYYERGDDESACGNLLVCLYVCVGIRFLIDTF
jgi:hypothetical protein